MISAITRSLNVYHSQQRPVGRLITFFTCRFFDIFSNTSLLQTFMSFDFEAIHLFLVTGWGHNPVKHMLGHFGCAPDKFHAPMAESNLPLSAFSGGKCYNSSFFARPATRRLDPNTSWRCCSLLSCSIPLRCALIFILEEMPVFCLVQWDSAVGGAQSPLP